MHLGPQHSSCGPLPGVQGLSPYGCDSPPRLLLPRARALRWQRYCAVRADAGRPSEGRRSTPCSGRHRAANGTRAFQLAGMLNYTSFAAFPDVCHHPLSFQADMSRSDYSSRGRRRHRPVRRAPRHCLPLAPTHQSTLTPSTPHRSRLHGCSPRTVS